VRKRRHGQQNEKHAQPTVPFAAACGAIPEQSFHDHESFT